MPNYIKEHTSVSKFNRYLLHIAGAIYLLATSCIEPFDPQINRYENLLVVDALLTNSEPAAIVYLSRSFPYNENRSLKEKQAEVRIRDEKGSVFQLTEPADGKYISGPDLEPVIGWHYILEITSSEGEEYASLPQEFLAACAIDSVFYEVNRNGDAGAGITVKLDAHGEEKNTRYYRWEWEESWQVISPFYKPGNPNICWLFEQSRGVEIGSTARLENNVLHEHAIYFQGIKTNKLAYRYSTLIKQYALTPENYNYLTKLKELNESAGGFFDPVPAALTSNIRNIRKPDLPVLGIFEASEHRSKRIFVDRSDLYLDGIHTGFETCEITEISLGDYRKGVLINWNFYEMYYNSQYRDTMVVLINKDFCYDCSILASPAQPDFWIDKRTK